MKKFVCSVCGYVYEGEAAPADVCPVCKAPASKFVEQRGEIVRGRRSTSSAWRRA